MRNSRIHWLCISGLLVAGCSGGGVAIPGGGDAAVPPDAAADLVAVPCGALDQPCCASGCTGGLTCGGGYCVVTMSPDFGKPCSVDADCASGACVDIGGGRSACSVSCPGGGCLAGWHCGPLTGQPVPVCQCTASAEICDGRDNDCDGVVDQDPDASDWCAANGGPGLSCQGGACLCAFPCGGQCVDPQIDHENCGACGHRCDATQTCVAGGCQCSPGRTLCGGLCADLMHDAAHCGGCANACPAMMACVKGQCALAADFQYVLDAFTLPMARTDFAIDLNGDGRVDNQLGNIIGALAAQGLDAQGANTMSVADGLDLLLIDVITTDSLEQNDPGASAVFNAAAAQPMPDFSGTGMYTIDMSALPAIYAGPLANGHFTSDNPVTTVMPVACTIRVAFTNPNPAAGVVPVPIPLNGCHVQFDVGTDAASGAPGLLRGQLNGSIRQKDVQTSLIPALAQTLTAQIAANPGAPIAQQIEQLFDTGGCVNPDGSMAVAFDGRIDPCELSQNNIVMNILAPDVQIYDAAGNYAPNPQNTSRDALSVGIGFTAVQASF